MDLKSIDVALATAKVFYPLMLSPEKDGSTYTLKCAIIPPALANVNPPIQSIDSLVNADANLFTLVSVLRYILPLHHVNFVTKSGCITITLTPRG